MTRAPLAILSLLLLLSATAPRLAGAATPGAAETTFEAIREPPAGPPITDAAALEAETHRLARLLRCPVCQGLSVADSREGLSLAMRDRIRELVAEGYTQDQILDYFVLRYGESIVLLPDTRHRLVWLGPLGALVLGLAVVGLRLRGGATAPSATPPPAPAADTEDEYRRRVLAELEEG